MQIRKPLGIDLGTTNSVIAMLDPTDSNILVGKDEAGRMTFPSVVGWDPDAPELLVGRSAHALKGGSRKDSDHTLSLSSIKRFMGLDHQFTLGPHVLSPEEVSARILRLLLQAMASTMNDPRRRLDSAVMTMPAYFNHNQIEATRKAGELAGLDVVELLHEPTAAAIYYAWAESHNDANYLVYDLGGGTFDVSIIRRRLDDYEVVGVSGDPFLGGDDFDRLTATHLLHHASWVREESSGPIGVDELNELFRLETPDGARRFASLVAVAESMKIELTSRERAERYVPAIVRDAEGRSVSLQAMLDRDTFERLIRDKVRRTIDCCQEALARAREKAGLTLRDIDHVILVGGSSRVPLVQQTVRAAFCNPGLPDHVRSPEPLLHEPDLCVAFGAALRAATHGTHYLDANARTPLALHWTSPTHTQQVLYTATGKVRQTVVDRGSWATNLEGGSVRIRSLATGLIEETFLDQRGGFSQEIELQPETDNILELTVCDDVGQPLSAMQLCVRHRTQARRLGQGVLPTQLITKPLQIEVLNKHRRRVKQVVAAVGSPLPGVFQCTCRTQDQVGRIVVPIFEENRVIKHMVVDDLAPTLPIGSPVEVELALDVSHNMEVRVRVRHPDGSLQRSESAVIELPPPPRRPTRAEVDEVLGEVDTLLLGLHGKYRTRMRTRVDQLRQDLLEALTYDDEPKAIQRMAELRDLAQQLTDGGSQTLDPPWPRFAQLVRHCLDCGAETAQITGRDREELFAYVRAQERYAEQAFEETNQGLYRECWENLVKYAGYLENLLRDAVPQPPVGPALPPEEEARVEVERFRGYLTSVWKLIRSRERMDLDARMVEIARQAQGMHQRSKTEPHAVLRDVRRLGVELSKLEDAVHGRRGEEGRRGGGEEEDDAGLLSE